MQYKLISLSYVIYKFIDKTYICQQIIKSHALTHFSPVSHFYTPWKRQKAKGFLAFSGGIEMWHWTKMG